MNKIYGKEELKIRIRKVKWILIGCISSLCLFVSAALCFSSFLGELEAYNWKTLIAVLIITCLVVGIILSTAAMFLTMDKLEKYTNQYKEIEELERKAINRQEQLYEGLKNTKYKKTTKIINGKNVEVFEIEFTITED